MDARTRAEALSGASEGELLAALRRRALEHEHATLNRGRATETRHVLLYVSQEAASLREYVVADKMRWSTAAAMLERLIGQLESIRAYIEPGSRKLPPIHANRPPALTVKTYSLCCGVQAVQQGHFWFCTWCQNRCDRIRQDVSIPVGTEYVRAQGNARRTEP